VDLTDGVQSVSKAEYNLQQRLEKVQSIIESNRFLNRERLGGELPFWIFDYPAELELEVRSYIEDLENRLKRKKMEFIHINLFHCLIEILESRNLLEKSYQLEKKKGAAGLKKALKAPLDQEKVADFISSKIQKQDRQFVLISGLGSAWPLLRGHSILNALHSRLGGLPMVLFYPGTYSGTELKTFGIIESSNYYRAFDLVPDEEKQV